MLPKGYYHRDSTGRTHFKSSGYPLLFHPKYPDAELLDWFKKQKEITYHPAPATLTSLGPGWSWDDFSYYYSAARSPLPLYGNVATLYPQKIEGHCILQKQYASYSYRYFIYHFIS